MAKKTVQEARFIVAEASTTWIGVNSKAEEADGGILAARFESIILTNESRGYYLKDWKFSQIHIPPNGELPAQLVETIIAVFEKKR